MVPGIWMKLAPAATLKLYLVHNLLSIGFLSCIRNKPKRALTLAVRLLNSYAIITHTLLLQKRIWRIAGTETNLFIRAPVPAVDLRDLPPELHSSTVPATVPSRDSIHRQRP